MGVMKEIWSAQRDLPLMDGMEPPMTEVPEAFQPVLPMFVPKTARVLEGLRPRCLGCGALVEDYKLRYCVNCDLFPNG